MDSDILSGWEQDMKPIFSALIQKHADLDISSYGGFEPSMITDEIMQMSLDVGFKSIIVPLDNSDSKDLVDWGGAKSVEHWKNGVAIAKKYFDKVSSYIMIGYPGQTRENVSLSISMCLNEGVSPELLPFTPIDGTVYEDNTMSPELKHPLLFPYAWSGMTVFDMEYLMQKYSMWYKKSTNDSSESVNVYLGTGPAITITGENNG